MTSRDAAALTALLAAVVCLAIAGFLVSAAVGFAAAGGGLLVVAVLLGRR